MSNQNQRIENSPLAPRLSPFLVTNPSPLAPRPSLALDELLLDKAETGELGRCLRLWTTDEYFVVMGTNGKAERECHEEQCRRDGVAILKRHSGGGTVLMGPGCLGWTVILNYKDDPHLADVRESYAIILGRVAGALRARDVEARVACCSDLAIGELKFGGNAQFRRHTWLMHHGTLLCGFDLDRVTRYLKHPPKEPPYRNGREHGQFLTNLPLTIEETSAALQDAFGPFAGLWSPSPEELERIQQ